MNSQINSLTVTGFVEDQIRAAAEARLLPEYQRQPAESRTHRTSGWRRHRSFSRTAQL
jgi:hypothetical protein